MSEPAQAVILTFEDIPDGSVQEETGHMPTYKGFNFSATLDWTDANTVSYSFGATSGDFAILNNNGGTGIVTDAQGAGFTFGGLWAKTWGTPAESGGADTVFGTLQGYNDSVLVWSVATGLNGSYEFYGAQAGAIDELRLGFGDTFLVDDIKLDAIPEPTGLALFALGAHAIMRRRRRREVAPAVSSTTAPRHAKDVWSRPDGISGQHRGPVVHG